MAKRTAEFEGVECVGESELALLCVIEGDQHWIPKSQVDDDSEVYQKGDAGKLIVTEWIAQQKKLI